jgi:hypothetical protein|tara:strand:+ start:3301 stop:5121 length:1821 start_codon:yes stop_codon:yes gene_type:complete
MQTNRNKRIREVDYTKASFNEIKEQLVQYAKRHYPNSYKDFKDSSFGSLMFDLVSYVGDQLHYYIDHNANESILPYTKDPEIALQLIQAMGAKPSLNFDSVGNVKVQILSPANSLGVTIDNAYKSVLNAGTKFKSSGGAVFTSMKPVVFTADTSRIIGYNMTDDGSKVAYYAMEAIVPVVSGEERTFTVDVGNFVRFLKIEIPDENLTEILSVTDSNGNEYFQVDSLPTDKIYKPILDPQKRDPMVPAIMKQTPVPRRFIVEKSINRTYIQFGHGSDEENTTNSFAEPTKRVMKFTGKRYDSSVAKSDPSRMYSNNKLGVAPQNTTLTIVYRRNTAINTNAAVGTINQVLEPLISFDNEQNLESQKVNFIRNNVQVLNDEPINGSISIPTTEELKRRYMGSFGAQGRAVTKEDYISAVYDMPPIYGGIKRAGIMRDTNDFRRNLNLFLIAEGADGKLQKPTNILKQNVKTWIDSVRMISDSIDIFDANIINFNIDFKVALKQNSNAQTVMSKIKQTLFEELTTIPPEIGEPLYMTEIMRIIQSIPEVANIPLKDGIKIQSLSGGKYTDLKYDVKSNTSPDNTFVYIPQNAIWEIKYIDDIKGTVIT